MKHETRKVKRGEERVDGKRRKYRELSARENEQKKKRFYFRMTSNSYNLVIPDRH